MRVLVTLLFLLAAAGCSSGPDAETLHGDLSARLSEALPPGTVVLTVFERRGSQRDPEATAEETRRILYFDVELKLERDYDFGAWDAPGIAGLLSTLGAGPKGIAGLTSGGNKTGDTLRAHGTAVYTRDADRWVAVVPGGYAPSAAPSYATNAPQTRTAAILAAIRQAIDSFPKDVPSSDRAVVEQELSAAYAAIRARLARSANGYAIAAGPEQGQYLRFARALSEAGDVRMVALVTRGGEENLRLLRDGKVSLALAQGDAALAAYEGKGDFEGDGTQSGLRALGSLYPEPVHVLVRADSPLRNIADLKGRRISIGEKGSASRTTALRILEAHGLGTEDVKSFEMPLRDALAALRSRDVDAVIQVIGMPANVFREALATLPLRLLPLSERAVQTLATANAGYFAYTIPNGAYAAQSKDVRTVATAAMLLVGVDLSDAEVDILTRLVFEKDRSFAAQGSAQGAQVSAATARRGLSIPLHRAAATALDAMTPAPVLETSPQPAGR
jgi:TRAP transporter TAXI family solute receptor